jgi:tetratricopeptide (TPR) repeat protein
VVVLAVASVLIIRGLGHSKFIDYKDRHLDTATRSSLEKQLQDAEQHLQNLPGNAKPEDKFLAYTQVGAQYFTLGELAKARSSFETAAKILPDNPSVWQELYQVEVEMQDYQSALASIDKALVINPSNISDWRSKLTLEQNYLKVSGDKLEAVYKEAIDKTQLVDFMATYADLLEQDGKPGEALNYWQKAMDHAPTNELYNSYRQSLEALQKKMGK